ncbi:MAG: response regulator transcription factor [Ktedonobacterales bacterium]|nr:response regulator transcription factor [Ktedonobacterales bacterium]
MIRLMLIDDHQIIREGLRAMLATRPDVTIVGDVGNGTDALRLMRQLTPDIALLDLEMPGLDGVGILHAMQQEGLTTKIIVLTAFGSDEHILRAIGAGARGYLLKDAGMGEVMQAIDTVMAGGSLLAPHVVGRVMASMGQMLQTGTIPATLTERERAILTRSAQGQTSRAIGDQLGLAERTVKFHLSIIYQKLGVTNRTEAVAQALRSHLITLPD